MPALAGILYLTHLAVLCTVLSPFFFPAGSWLKYVILLICLVLLDWHLPLDDRRCSLTSLESKVRGTWDPDVEGDAEMAPAFWYPLINKLLSPLGIKLTRKEATSLNYVVFVSALLVAFAKLQAFNGRPIAFRGRSGTIASVACAFLAGIWAVDAYWEPGRRA